MTNRAHHPADRGSGEFTKDDPDAPGAGEPAAGGVDEAVSRAFVLPPNVERVLARAAEADDDDDDAEEVELEPDSADATPTPPAEARSTSERPEESGERTGAAEAVAAAAEGAVPSDAAGVAGVGSSDAASGSAPPPL